MTFRRIIRYLQSSISFAFVLLGEIEGLSIFVPLRLLLV